MNRDPRESPSQATDSGELEEVEEVDSILDDKYEIEALLGEGGFATVYRARHRRIGSLQVAVKVLKRKHASKLDVVRRFRREAETAAALQNRHTVRIMDMGETPEGLPYIVMEYVDGVPLDDVIHRLGSLAPATVARLALGVLMALDEAHSHGIIHRDLKPGNILVVREHGQRFPIARVVDFGIAKVLTANLEGSPNTTLGDDIFCTPEYAAPELLRGQPSYQTDLYALGHVMIEMLSGKPAYSGVGPFEVAAHQLAMLPVPLSQNVQSSGLQEVIARAVKKDASQRFATAHEMLSELKRAYGDVLRKGPEEEIPELDSWFPSSRREPRRSPAPAEPAVKDPTPPRASAQQSPVGGEPAISTPRPGGLTVGGLARLDPAGVPIRDPEESTATMRWEGTARRKTPEPQFEGTIPLSPASIQDADGSGWELPEGATPALGSRVVGARGSSSGASQAVSARDSVPTGEFEAGPTNVRRAGTNSGEALGQGAASQEESAAGASPVSATLPRSSAQITLPKASAAVAPPVPSTTSAQPVQGAPAASPAPTEPTQESLGNEPITLTRQKPPVVPRPAPAESAAPSDVSTPPKKPAASAPAASGEAPALQEPESRKRAEIRDKLRSDSPKRGGAALRDPESEPPVRRPAVTPRPAPQAASASSSRARGDESGAVASGSRQRLERRATAPVTPVHPPRPARPDDPTGDFAAAEASIAEGARRRRLIQAALLAVGVPLLLLVVAKFALVEPGQPRSPLLGGPSVEARAIDAARGVIHAAATAHPNQTLDLSANLDGVEAWIGRRRLGPLPLRDVFAPLERPVTITFRVDGYRDVDVEFAGPRPIRYRVVFGAGPRH